MERIYIAVFNSISLFRGEAAKESDWFQTSLGGKIESAYVEDDGSDYDDQSRSRGLRSVLQAES